MHCSAVELLILPSIIGLDQLAKSGLMKFDLDS